jgi:hypothetical protein
MRITTAEGALFASVMTLTTGVVVLLLGQRSSRKQERERWEREDRTRWHADRWRVYVRFAEAIGQVYEELNDLCRFIRQALEERDVQEMSDMIYTDLNGKAELRNAVFGRLEEVQFLASVGTAEAATAVADRVHSAFVMTAEAEKVDLEVVFLAQNLEEVLAGMRDAREAFREAVRRELHVEW